MMEGLSDAGSPRRGSLSSLHRQPSGSFSHSSRLSNSPNSSNGLQANNIMQLNTLCKDLDKFTRYFIIKAVQVIVQSRIGSNQKLRLDCKPSGNDWFNINIADIAEVSEQTRNILDAGTFTVKSNWRLCCELSLKTNDGSRTVLEHWIISNRASQSIATTSPKLSTLNPSKSPLMSSRALRNGYPVSPSAGRTRHATICTTTRTRLNSIDDCSDDDLFKPNKISGGANKEKCDFKSSTSCYALSHGQATNNQETNISFATSPSIDCLNNASVSNTPNLSNQTQQQESKTIAMSSIYTIYNRMSLLLKTIMTATYIVPAYRLASKVSQSDSCVICYRIYSCPGSLQPLKSRLSDESLDALTDSPIRRAQLCSVAGPPSLKEFVGPEELEFFCPIMKLGSIKTEVSELDISVSYRTDLKNPSRLTRNLEPKQNYGRILDEDCILAAKQLLAGNAPLDGSLRNSPVENGFTDVDRNQETSSLVDKPLRPAFASNESKVDRETLDPGLTILDSAFETLLQPFKSSESLSEQDRKPSEAESNNKNLAGFHGPSDPIQVPCKNLRTRQAELQSTGSTPRSLTDSFVFLDINPPFASEEQNDISSFFHGPSPAFNSLEKVKDVSELTDQLASIEANASQIDEFVDNMCATEDEDDDE